MPIMMRLVAEQREGLAEHRVSGGGSGGDGMNWSQNSTLVAKKLPCISHMCTVLVPFAQVKRSGQVPRRSSPALNRAIETQVRSSSPPNRRSGRDQAASTSTPRVTLRPDRPGSAQCGAYRAAAATAAPGDDQQRRRGESISSRCWIIAMREEVVVGPVVDRVTPPRSAAPPARRRTTADLVAARWRVRSGRDRRASRRSPISWPPGHDQGQDRGRGRKDQWSAR